MIFHIIEQQFIHKLSMQQSYLIYHASNKKDREKKATYHGKALNSSYFCSMKKMHACLNDIALNASDKSYMRDTFSTAISLRWKKINR